MNDDPGEAFWLGVGSPEAIRRQLDPWRDGVAPGFAAALRANGPIDALALCAQGIAMGDDCHMRHQATTMLLLREALRRWPSTPPTACCRRPGCSPPTATSP